MAIAPDHAYASNSLTMTAARQGGSVGINHCLTMMNG
jgi:hypothetical protein